MRINLSAMKKLSIIIISLFAGTALLNAQANDGDIQNIGRTGSNNVKSSGSVSAGRRSTRNGNQTSVSSGSKLSGTADKGYWEFGGNIGLSFGDYTSVNISPQVGYRFNRYFGLGGGISYNYYDDKDYDYSLNYLGFNIYGRIYPVRYLMVFAQPEFHKRWGSVHGVDTKNEYFSCMLLGVGGIIPVGPRSAMTVSAYYDVSQNKYSPYGDNIGYSVGYTFNF